jgi:hypothetical protein
MVDNIEEPLSHEQILKRSTKMFRREMTAIECRRALLISNNEATLKGKLNPASSAQESIVSEDSTRQAC